MKRRYYYLLALAALAISLIYDKQMLTAITSYRTDELDFIFKAFSLLGTLIIIPLLAASAAIFYKRANGNIPAIWTSVGIAVAATYAIKYLVNRDRPDFANPLEKISSPSFPSAHSSASFAPVPVLHSNLKKLWILFAVFVAFSRAYLGVHYISDIIAGAILGNAIGDLAARVPFSKVKLLKRLRIA